MTAGHGALRRSPSFVLIFVVRLGGELEATVVRQLWVSAKTRLLFSLRNEILCQVQ